MRFEDVLQDNHISYDTEGRNCRPGWTQLDCPFCQGVRYLGFNRAGNYLNCWRCGAHSVVETLAELTKQPVHVIKKLVGGLEKDRKVLIKPTGKLVLPRGIGDLQRAHLKYLEDKRRYDPAEIIRLWDVRGIGLASRLSWRLFIPIYFHGELVSWTTRAVRDDVTSRYISAGLMEEALPHKDLLYGEDYVRHAVIVHEGPLDVWRTGPGAVATCGVGYSPAQVLRLAKYPVRVICFDNETKAQRRASLLCDALEPFPGTTFNVELSRKDASASSKKAIARLRAEFLE
jgi:hypothetical protein